MYNVVFEYTEETEGYAGVRTWTSYDSREQFLRLKASGTFLKVIAEDVTDEEAIDLTCQTREIARIKAAIQKAVSSEQLTAKDLWFHIDNAILAIMRDRKHLRRPYYSLAQFPDMYDNFSALSPQTILNIFAEKAADKGTGRVDLLWLSKLLLDALVLLADRGDLK